MNVKSVFFSLVVVLIAATVSAQQEISSQFWNNYSYYNPANSGMEYNQFYTLQGQVTDVEIGNSLWALADVRVKKLHGSIGLNYAFTNFNSPYIYYDYTGSGWKPQSLNGISHNSQQAKLNYSLHLNLGERSLLGIGVSLGGQQVTIDPDYWVYWDPNDPLIPEGNATRINVGVGLCYLFKNFKIGASSTYINEDKWKFKDGPTYDTYRNYHFLASYHFRIFSNLKLHTQLVHHLLTEYEWHYTMANLRIIYKDCIWLGGSFEDTYGRSIMAGVTIFKKIGLTYSYMSNMTGFFGPTHEVALSFSIQP